MWHITMENADNISPVFIGGCSRSGTTLLGAMLGAHSECICTPESQFKIDVYRKILKDNGEGINTKEILASIADHKRFKIWELPIEDAEIQGGKNGTTYAEIVLSLVKKYGVKKVGKKKASLWIDHSPDNIRYALTLFNIFPDARMIHLIRDGRAIASSVMSLDWWPVTVVSWAHIWMENLAYGLAAESVFDSSRIIRIRYEDLVKQPEETMGEICSFLNISYEPQMVNAKEFKIPQYTSEQHKLVGKGIDTSRLNAWKDVLTPRQIEIFESITGELLKMFGYEQLYGLKAKETTIWEKIEMVVTELYKGPTKWFKFKFRTAKYIK